MIWRPTGRVEGEARNFFKSFRGVGSLDKPEGLGHGPMARLPTPLGTPSTLPLGRLQDIFSRSISRPRSRGIGVFEHIWSRWFLCSIPSASRASRDQPPRSSR